MLRRARKSLTRLARARRRTLYAAGRGSEFDIAWATACDVSYGATVRVHVLDDVLPVQPPQRAPTRRVYTDGSMATTPAKHSIGIAADGLTGVGGGEQKTNHRPNGQIVEVVSHEGGLLDAHTHVVLKAREGGRLVFDAHEAMVDAQLPCTHLRRSSLATAEEGDVNPRLLQQADPKPIAHIEALAQLPLGIEPETPIGEDAIHVQDEQFN